jgi:uncharacterized protein (TIGR03000 family)
MYSIVLTMALMNGGATPAVGFEEDGVVALNAASNVSLSSVHEAYRHHRGGCCGGCYGGCCGGCCGGCWGCCGGCYGGWGGGGRGYAYADGGYAPTVASAPGSYEYQAGYPTMGQTNEATIVVTLPAEAKLTIDGKATTSTSQERAFVTPPLTPGKTYHYTLRAEMERDGRPVTQTKDVIVRPGRESRVNLDLSGSDAGTQ